MCSHYLLNYSPTAPIEDNDVVVSAFFQRRRYESYGKIQPRSFLSAISNDQTQLINLSDEKVSLC